MAVRFKNILDMPCGIRYMYSNLDLISPLSVSMLLESEMETSKNKILLLYSNLSEFKSLMQEGGKLFMIKDKIALHLSQLKDIRNSLKRISEGVIADDIELFEIKSLALINQKIRDLLKELDIKAITFPNIENVLNLLDPDQNRITSFYIYDSYSTELKKLRERLKQDDSYNEETLYQCAIIEDKIRLRLSKEIKKEFIKLKDSLYNLSQLDILMAKALQLHALNLSIPTLSLSGIAYKELFNPEVANILLKKGRDYQNTDITVNLGKPLLITGSNMGGKSLTLKTIALCQYLFQFGFGIPAKSAFIIPVQEVHLSSGDDEDYKKGLSSFAAEMKRIDKMIQKINEGSLLLSLTDEPARTTNPAEGQALASALLEILSRSQIVSVVTTHYTIENENCDRLRVRGFIDGNMDYSLISDNMSQTPAEALNIAASLGVNSLWLELARKELEKNLKHK
ncbi:MAG: DNA mismatch repair protein MutS [Bacteroidales bacterium]